MADTTTSGSNNHSPWWMGPMTAGFFAFALALVTVLILKGKTDFTSFLYVLGLAGAALGFMNMLPPGKRGGMNPASVLLPLLWLLVGCG